jgi:hypothetical protein
MFTIFQLEEKKYKSEEGNIMNGLKYKDMAREKRRGSRMGAR